MRLPDFVTFSGNVFLPITNVCRNQCRYCGFRRDPAHPDANLMTVSEVAKILDAGKRAGCTEALFTFEEMPEEHSEFREWIEDIRYSSVIDYLIDLCEIAIDCGMLPHSNPDVLESRDIRRALAAQCEHGADGRVYAFTGIVTGDPNHDGAVNAAGGDCASDGSPRRMDGNTGESGEYTVRIDAAAPEVPVVASTHPDAGVDTTGKQKV